jgi:hypothetical protein
MNAAAGLPYCECRPKFKGERCQELSGSSVVVVGLSTFLVVIFSLFAY